jgi:recombination protein RecT
MGKESTMSQDLLKKHDGWTDQQFQSEYGDQWEYMKAQDEFARLPKDVQERIRAQQAEEWQSSRTSLAKVKTYAELAEVKQRFINLLGEAGGRSYVESVVIAVSNNAALQKCSPKSIFISAMRAASLKLSVDPALRQAHLVPYGDEATLIVDYHGLLALSVNTGYYEKAPHVSEVYEGEVIKYNRLTGEVQIEGEKTSDKIIGWMAYFKARNGTERWEYMTNEQIDAHAQKYNPKGFDNPKGVWNKEREKMRRKTVLRILLTKWGNFSPEVKSIIERDEPDNIIDATFEMPSDDIEVIEETPRRSEEENLSQLGFGGTG